MKRFESKQNSQKDIIFMMEAISEAARANSSVYPNPKVGCVIVENENIIARGYHHKYGQNHAEKNALKSLDGTKKNLTMYVTLEPCNHYGKTSPCARLIKSKQFSRVVIAEKDPTKKASGGIEYLLKNEINVDVGICKEEARELNKYFYTYHEKKRPYVILKYASSLDGFIALKNGESKWITNQKSRSINHEQRSDCDAILVGRKTIEFDDPILNSHKKGRDPKVVILDPDEKIGKKSKIFNLKNPPIIFTQSDLSTNKKENIEVILNKLFDQEIQSVLVEGGGFTITAFLDSGIFDEIHVYLAPKLFGKGIPIYQGEGINDNVFKLKLHNVQTISNDIKIVYKRVH